MAKFVLKNVRLFSGGADLTTRNNRLELSVEAESKDSTAFAPSGDVWHEELSGIRSTSATGAGQWEAGDLSMVDDHSWAGIGSVGPLTMCPAGAADGALAYLTAYARQAYTLGGSVGDVIPWSGNWNGNWALARGVVLANPTPRTATGSGSVFQLPAVAAGQSLVGSLHVMSIAGTGSPSVTATIQSADLVGFGSPTTRLTFNLQNTIGGQVFRLAGPITDTFYRVNYTVAGTAPSLLFMSAAGVSA